MSENKREIKKATDGTFWVRGGKNEPWEKIPDCVIEECRKEKYGDKYLKPLILKVKEIVEI